MNINFFINGGNENANLLLLPEFNQIENPNRNLRAPPRWKSMPSFWASCSAGNGKIMAFRYTYFH